MRRTRIWPVLAFLVLPGFVLAQGLPQKIGVFDAGRLSSETDLGKTITTRLNELQEQRRGELLARGKAVQDLQSQLAAQALSLSQEKRTAIEKDIQKKSLELEQAQESARNELQLEYTEEQEKFQQKIVAAIDQFSRDEKFSLILEKSTTAYADPALDVTTALVDRFNKLFPPPPPPQQPTKP